MNVGSASASCGERLCSRAIVAFQVSESDTEELRCHHRVSPLARDRGPAGGPAARATCVAQAPAVVLDSRPSEERPRSTLDRAMKRPVLVAAVLLLAAWVVTSLVRDPHSPRSAEHVAIGADSHAGTAQVDADSLAAPAAVASSRAEATQRSTPGRDELVVLVENDLGEQHDLSAAQPQLARQLHQRLQQWRQQVDAKMPAEK